MSGKPNKAWLETMVKKHGSREAVARIMAEIGAKGGKNGNTCGILPVMSKVKNIELNPAYKVLSSGVILGKNGEPMKPQIDAKGYLRVQIKTPEKENGVTTLKIHRVVAEHFIPNPDNLPQIDHIDNDKSNNDVSNLDWVTNKENQNRAKLDGLYLKRTPLAVKQLGGQVLTAILSGYLAKDLFELNGIERKTFWKAVSDGRIVEEPIENIELGRKKKYYYYDASRKKWRVERSDFIAKGRQFDTEQEAIEYANEVVGAGGFYGNRELASRAGKIGGTRSRRVKG